jgi:hypothetical protein
MNHSLMLIGSIFRIVLTMKCTESDAKPYILRSSCPVFTRIVLQSTDHLTGVSAES